MNHFFHPEAAEELAEGVEYYENCAPGLGYDFSFTFFSALESKNQEINASSYYGLNECRLASTGDMEGLWSYTAEEVSNAFLTLIQYKPYTILPMFSFVCQTPGTTSVA